MIVNLNALRVLMKDIILDNMDSTLIFIMNKSVDGLRSTHNDARKAHSESTILSLDNGTSDKGLFFAKLRYERSVQ